MGSQEDGRLTQSGSGARNTPYLVKKSSSGTQYGLVQVVAAWGHSCARTISNKVICWGEGKMVVWAMVDLLTNSTPNMSPYKGC